MGISNKTPEFLKMNPIGKVILCKFSIFIWILLELNPNLFERCMLMQVPVLETPNGPIFESNAIARYGRI